MRRNQSASKLASKTRLGLNSSGTDLASLKMALSASADGVIPDQAPRRFTPWSGSYCSEECMQKDEQRSRLAIANLQTRTPLGEDIPHRASSTAGSSSSNSHHSTTSDDNPYVSSSYSSNRPYRQYYESTIRRNSRSALSLTLKRTSSQDRGSSDSLASQNSPAGVFALLSQYALQSRSLEAHDAHLDSL